MAVALKPVLRGLVSMGPCPFIRRDNGLPDNSFADLWHTPRVMSGAVINALWWQLNPQPGHYNTDSIDTALAQLRRYNAANPARPVAARLRVWGAQNAPYWVKKIGGPPIYCIVNPTEKFPIHVGRYWTPAYLDFWRALHAKLASQYDAEPLIADITNTTTAVETDEPFHPFTDVASLRGVEAAGYTDAIGLANLEASIDWLDEAGWKRTRFEFPCAEYHHTDGAHLHKPDPAVTVRIMDAVRAKYGARVVLGNHAMDDPFDPAGATIYPEQKRLGAPISYQTKSPPRMPATWDGVVRNAVALGANSLELWVLGAKSWHQWPTETLHAWDAALRANPSP